MAMFDRVQKIEAERIYVKLHPYLKRDGLYHVIMINSFSKLLNQIFECESKYTNQIDAILTSMQTEGFVILDVKFNSIMNQGIHGEMEGFHTLISYRYDEHFYDNLVDQRFKRSSTPKRVVTSTQTFENTHACQECDYRVSKEFVEGGYNCPGCGAPNRCLVESPLPDKPEKPESI